jgi:hypothetical protein
MEYPSFFGLTDRWFWAVAVFVVVANVVIMRARAAVDVRSHPERKRGYNRLIAAVAAALVLGLAFPVLAILSGRVSSVFELIDPGRNGPAMLGFYVAGLILGGLLLCWVWFWGGLRTFASYPAIFNLPRSEAGLRLFFGGMTLFFVVAALVVAVSQPWVAQQ